MDFNNPLKYDPINGRWSLELYKAPKDAMAQCGVKITIDPGIPTGEKGAFYQTKEPAGLAGTMIEVRCFDNLSGWTSAVAFDFATFFEKLIEVMPQDKIKHESFVLAERDVACVKNKKEKEKKENE